MRILVVSFRFAPYASMGAARVGGFVEEWIRDVHEVFVISAANQCLPETLELPISAAQVCHVEWPSPKGAESGKEMSRAGWKRELVRAYVSLFLWPDSKSAWIKPAIEAARSQQADIVFSSGLPVSSLVAAKQIAENLGVPWVAELRDPWIGNAYGLQPHNWRAQMDLRRQKSLNPDAWVVATPGMADLLESQLGQRPEVILTGVDQTRELREGDPEKLVLVHTGEMYGGQRDPAPLLNALVDLSPEERARVQVDFYGRDPGPLPSQIEERNLQANVKFRGMVSRAEALRKQSEADILLLLTPNRANESYVLTGKLFEYLAARRPIWVLGHPAGGAAKFVRDYAAGRHLDPVQIAPALQSALSHKPGWVPRPTGVIDASLSRQHQARRLLEIMEKARK